LIADYFPPERRTTANAFFAGCIFIGSSLSSLTVVMIGQVGWRESYLIIGIYGICAGAICITFIKEPERG
jgi:MFS family permease